MVRHSWRAKWSYRVFKNEEIKAHKILLLDSEGNKIGLVSRKSALDKAQEQGLDLVQVGYNPREQVCTAKLVDFGKYMYDKKKAENEKKKNQKSKGQKEVKFWYNIGDHDLELKLKKAQEFLEDGYVVKLMVVLRWREKAYKELVRSKLEHAETYLADAWRSQWIKEEHFGFTLVLLSKR